MGLSRRKVVVRRRTTVRVKVTVRGRPQRSVRVVARAAGRKLGSARTGRSGKARLVLRARKIGKVRIKAAVSPSCSPGVIKVVRR